MSLVGWWSVVEEYLVLCVYCSFFFKKKKERIFLYLETLKKKT